MGQLNIRSIKTPQQHNRWQTRVFDILRWCPLSVTQGGDRHHKINALENMGKISSWCLVLWIATERASQECFTCHSASHRAKFLGLWLVVSKHSHQQYPYRKTTICRVNNIRRPFCLLMQCFCFCSVSLCSLIQTRAMLQSMFEIHIKRELEVELAANWPH